jgi:hypothetical protein
MFENNWGAVSQGEFKGKVKLTKFDTISPFDRMLKRFPLIYRIYKNPSFWPIKCENNIYFLDIKKVVKLKLFNTGSGSEFWVLKARNKDLVGVDKQR